MMQSRGCFHFKSGEPFKVMNGDELGCSDLHLAVQDTLLVGQVIEDFQDTTKMHRLQVCYFWRRLPTIFITYIPKFLF